MAALAAIGIAADVESGDVETGDVETGDMTAADPPAASSPPSPPPSPPADPAEEDVIDEVDATGATAPTGQPKLYGGQPADFYEFLYDAHGDMKKYRPELGKLGRLYFILTHEFEVREGAASEPPRSDPKNWKHAPTHPAD